MPDLILSLPEKLESFKENGYLEHWMFVWELKELLSHLENSDWITPNEVHNLAISRKTENEDYIGYIDFLSNAIQFNDGKEIHLGENKEEEK